MFNNISKEKQKKVLNRIKGILSLVLTNNEIKDLINRIPYIKEKLNEDALTSYKSDPSYNSLEEAILTSPGLYAIMGYRISNALVLNKVKIIPRLLSEFIHSKTGIDINPEAYIGRNFFIDHGTGIVIGGTTYIGDNVKLYHGVTLGSKFEKSIDELRILKRHPTIENNVTIYSNSTILGGKTIIGEGSIIGCNKVVKESVSPYTKIV
jgi:serine O-acetyltransferase